MPAAPRQFDVLVLGAGAAGLMCAAVAGRRGLRAALLDHNAQPGRKILISGGGRCNFTNIHCTAANFLSRNPHFAKSALAGYQPRHFVELVERYGIRWHEKTLGQLFCDHSAREIVQMLLAECDKGGVERIWNARGTAVEGDSGGFRVAWATGEATAGALVVATGGLSIPLLGATGLAYELARQFGLKLVEPRPALVPLVLAGDAAGWTRLAGVSAEVTARSGDGPGFREKLLVTHRGLSGPAVLQASSYWRAGEALEVDFAPGVKAGQLLAAMRRPGGRRDEAGLQSVLREAVPQRLAAHLAEAMGPDGWTNAALEAREKRLHRWQFYPAGTEGFGKAEVTAGGVDTDGLEAKTMEARAVPGLYFIGEAVDVTGHLGGFNFQWAWASAVAAGKSI